tara:strand:+ start:86 stop:250 length:165 start_codon:yes stop_codon:yes gene_type:complete
MIDFGKYTWTIMSAYGSTGFLIMMLIIQTILKSRKVKKELLFVEQEEKINVENK